MLRRPHEIVIQRTPIFGLSLSAGDVGMLEHLHSHLVLLDTPHSLPSLCMASALSAVHISLGQGYSLVQLQTQIGTKHGCGWALAHVYLEWMVWPLRPFALTRVHSFTAKKRWAAGSLSAASFGV